MRSLPDQAQGGAGGRQGGGDYLQLATLVPGHPNQHLTVVVEDLDQQKLTLVVQVDRVTGDERPGLGHKLPFCQVGRSPQICTAHKNEVKLNFQENSESNSK